MKLELFLVATLLLACVAGASAQDKVNFAGTWKLDVAKSKLGGGPGIESQTLVVTQTATEIKVEQKTKRAAPPADAPQGGRPGGGQGRGGMMGGGDGTTTYKLDGKETTINVDGPMGSMPVVLKAKVDGNKLQTWQTRTFNGPNGEISTKLSDSWDAGVDGKTLTINREITSPRGTNSTTMVYLKQE